MWCVYSKQSPTCCTKHLSQNSDGMRYSRSWFSVEDLLLHCWCRSGSLHIDRLGKGRTSQRSVVTWHWAHFQIWKPSYRQSREGTAWALMFQETHHKLSRLRFQWGSVLVFNNPCPYSSWLFSMLSPWASWAHACCCIPNTVTQDSSTPRSEWICYQIPVGAGG